MTAAPDIGPGNSGAICRDLPSPYLPHPATGLLHLPRFLAKIRKHLHGALPATYQRNFCRGFDGYLCGHLGIDPARVIDVVRQAGGDPEALEAGLRQLFPADLRVARWNRQLVQIGLSEAGQEKLQEIKEGLGIGHRRDLRTFADVIDFDEGRLD